MRRLTLILLVLIVPAVLSAQTATPICPGVQMTQFYRSLGDQALTVSTNVVMPTIPVGAVFAVIDVQTADLRLRDDGGTVTASNGQLWRQDSHPVACGRSLSQLQLIRDTAATANSLAYFSYYGP